VVGTVLTGWQRYDHFSSLCELLPVSLPSLAVCLVTLQHGGLPAAQLSSINHMLGCAPDGQIQWTINTQNRPGPSCQYTGHELLEAAYELKNAYFYLGHFQSFKGWHTEYLLKRNFAQPFRMNYALDKCYKGLARLKNAERLFSQHMSRIFNQDTLTEYLETQIYPLREEFLRIKSLAEQNKKHNAWPRRPMLAHTNNDGQKVPIQ